MGSNVCLWQDVFGKDVIAYAPYPTIPGTYVTALVVLVQICVCFQIDY